MSPAIVGASVGPGCQTARKETCHLKLTLGASSPKHLLGGHFGPEKKYLAPPPPSPQAFPRHLPSPAPPSRESPPPSLCFLFKPAPLAASSDASPFPPPQNRKKKQKNIRNVHQVCQNSPVRNTPPYRWQYPFEIVSQRWVSHPFALFS